jgi:glyoxylase-like metal-dependent hydrolase (beta-lactamase superfamily II)
VTRWLPPSVHVFVRDWLSANQIVLKEGDDIVAVDSGYGKHVPLTLALLASRQGADGKPLARLVNTHCHADHMGGNAAIKRAWGCPVAIPEGEAPLIARWDTVTLLIDYAGQTAERFPVDEIIRAGTTHVWGGLEWRALAAPGHAMGALVFYNAEHRILISGDALWENGYGIVMPPEMEPAALPATRATLDVLAALDVRTVIPGHGEPFSDVAAALDRAFSRTAAFEQDSTRVARHAAKALLTFTLLERERMTLADLPTHLARVGVFRDLNERYFRLAPPAYADMLVSELERVGAAKRSAGILAPA